MNPWSKRPGKKISVPRFSLESWAQYMADPKQYSSMLREHARSIREQLKLLDKRSVLSVLPEADLIRAITTKLQQIREKSLHFCKDFFSLVSVWSGRRGSNSRPFAWEAKGPPYISTLQLHLEHESELVFCVHVFRMTIAGGRTSAAWAGFRRYVKD